MKITKVVPVSLSETEFVVYDDGAGLPEWVVGKFGTEHSYGELAPNWDTPVPLKNVRLEHPLSATEAKAINTKHRHLLCKVQTGAMDRRFETDQAVINCALEKWKSVFPEANLLVLGRGVAQPEQPLAGDKALFEATLKIWKKWQPMWDDGGWENSEYEKRMEALCQRWMRPHSPESSCIIAYVPTAAAL